MKISYLLASIGRTGGNVVIFHHMEALTAAGHDVYMITPFGNSKWEKGSLEAAMNENNYGYRGYWSYLKKIQGFLKKNFAFVEKTIKSKYLKKPLDYSGWITKRLLINWVKADITIATHSHTALACALLMGDTRGYYHMQGFEPWFIEDKWFKQISLLSYHYPLIKIANCYWLQKKITDLTNENIQLVRPGLNHDIFNLKYAISKKYAETEVIKIVSYADDRPLKGWKESLEAMGEIFKKYKNTEIKIEWSVFGSISSADVDYDINYKGFLSHEKLAELYANSHIVFIPSWFESFPLQPIEAMACGTTVLTTRIGTEDYAHHKNTAFVIEPRNVDAIRDGLITLIEDRELMKQIALNGLLEASKYNWEQSATEMFEALGL